MTPTTLHVSLGGRVILRGKLYHDIKQGDSMWLMEDGIMHLTMLKRNRRGSYADRCTNADTFWRSIMHKSPEQEVLQLTWPPAKYYHLPLEDAAIAKHPQLTA